MTYVDNEPYWEAWYKLLKSNLELFKANRSDPDAVANYERAQQGLKKLYIVDRRPGGERRGDEFEQLRKDLIPDFDPASIPVADDPEPSTQPVEPEAATQPVAAGVAK